MKKIAIIILNYNGKELLKQFLPKVIKFSEEANIYVADNCSTDNSVQTLKIEFPEITIIKNKENYGYAKGYNGALKFIEEPFWVLLNSDVEVTENWLKSPMYLFENDNKIAVIQPKILDFKNKEYYEYAGAAGGFIDLFGYPFCRGRIFNTLEKESDLYNQESDIFWASGACFFVRKDIFNLLNGFDDNYFAHQEEIDFCWRAINKGYSIKFTPKSTVFHIGGATLKNSNPKKTYLNFRNSLITLLKNLPNLYIIPIILSRLILDGIAGLQFLFSGKILHTLAIIKAHFSFYYNFYYCLKNRQGCFTNKYYKTKSILLKYYIFRKKFYYEI